MTNERSEHFRKLGALGGKSTAKKGPKHMATIGKRGGKANARKPTSHFQGIGRAGAKRLRELVEKGKASER